MIEIPTNAADTRARKRLNVYGVIEVAIALKPPRDGVQLELCNAVLRG